MKILHSLLNIEINFKITYLLDEICFIDIETTGLSRKYNQIYLIGLLNYDNINKSWQLTQFFSESISEEELILREFKSEVLKYKYIITYNGDNFDIPFINEKFKKYNIETIDIESIDLYKVLRSNKDFIEFSNLKLKTIEKELGIDREDTFTGLECIEFYKNYIITKSDSFFNYIVKHNRDDLYSMPKLLKIFEIIKENSSIEIDIYNEKITLELLSIEQSGDLILISGKSFSSLEFSSEYYTNFYSFTLNKDRSFQMKIEIKTARIDETIIAYYVDIIKLGLNEGIKDLSGQSPPNNILILRIHKQNILINIKNLIKEIVKTENINFI